VTQPAAKTGDTFFEYLVDENGSPDMNVLGTAAAPIEFKFVTPRAVLVHRMNFTVSGTGKEIQNGFFMLDELPNGITIIHRKSAPQGGGTIHNFGTGLVPIRRHADFGAIAGVDVDSDGAANLSRFSIRWTLERAGIPHRMQQFEEFVVNVRDDLLTGNIETMRAMVQGF